MGSGEYSSVHRYTTPHILITYQIPNPLFDLAGIIAGHFSIPFLTFFSATLIGKACIKTTVQSLAIVVLFSRSSVDSMLDWMQGNSWEWTSGVVKGLYEQAMEKYDSGGQSDGVCALSVNRYMKKASWLGMAWNAVMVGMIGYFCWSIVVSLARGKQKEYLMQIDNAKVGGSRRVK
jgi:hypothetical protein